MKLIVKLIKFDLGNLKRLFVVGVVVNKALLRYVQCVTDIWMSAVNVRVKYSLAFLLFCKQMSCHIFAFTCCIVVKT